MHQLQLAQIVKNGHLRNKKKTHLKLTKILGSSVCRHLFTSQHHIYRPTLGALPTVDNALCVATHFLAMQQQKYHLHQISCHWTFRKQAASSPVPRSLKFDTQMILQHLKLQQRYRDQKPQVLFSIEIFVLKLKACSSIEYIHANWPCHEPTFAEGILINIHHRKLLHMS